MNKEKIEYYAHLTLTVVGVFFGAYVFFCYLFLPVLPFIIAWATALILRPVSRRISDKTGISRKLVGVSLAIVTVSVGLGAVIAIFVLILGETWDVLSELVKDERIYLLLKKIADPIGELFGEGDGVGELSGYLGDTLKNAVSSLAELTVGVLTKIAKGIPRVLFFIIVTVIASIYFSLDIDNINARVRGILPKKAANTLCRLKSHFLSVGIKYIRSYLILMLITFFVMLVGFLILGIENAFLFALVIALVDLLPLIGVGMILVPWSIFAFVFGAVGLGIGLAVLFVVHEILRQLAEPKIIGKSLGIHPVISLVLLYVGYTVFGIGGLLLTPIASVAIRIFSNKNNSSEVGEGEIGKGDGTD